MLNTKIEKENFDAELYTKCARWANDNGCIMVEHDDYYQVEEIQYDLEEEKEITQAYLLSQYKKELSSLIDPTELTSATMFTSLMELDDSNNTVDIIAADGTPQTVTQDELQQLIIESMTKRNELLEKYKTLYNKAVKAKTVKAVHNIVW